MRRNLPCVLMRTEYILRGELPQIYRTLRIITQNRNIVKRYGGGFFFFNIFCFLKRKKPLTALVKSTLFGKHFSYPLLRNCS